MKKKIILMLVVVCIMFLGVINVKAASFTPKQLVDYIKQGSNYKYLNSVEGFSWEISYNENAKRIENKYKGMNSKKEPFEIEFVMNYDEENNSLHYKTTTDDKDLQITEDLILSMIIYDLSEMYGYDTKAVATLLKSEEIEDYTLEEDGIEVSREELIDYEFSDGTKINGYLINELKISLSDGFGHLEPVEKPLENDSVPTRTEQSTTIPSTTKTTQVRVENPKTSDINSNVLTIGLLGCIGIILMAKKKLNKVSR